MTYRGSTNRNERGGSDERRRRKQFLLVEFGNGTEAPCQLKVSDRCLGMVTMDTISVDRIVPKASGGTYRRDNIRPACGPCQSRQGGLIGNAIRWGK